MGIFQQLVSECTTEGAILGQHEDCADSEGCENDPGYEVQPTLKPTMRVHWRSIFVAIFCMFISAFDLSEERRNAAREKRIAEYKMAARLLRFNI